MEVHGKNQGAAGNVKIGTQTNYFDGNQTGLPDSIPPIKNFIGREDYLKRLRELYESGERSFVLHGTGGVGKTATTLKFAGEIAGKYKAKIFVDMQGTGENPLSAQEAMFIVVRTFEPQISADIPPPQLEGLFFSFVQRQPTLIILDNAESEAQVAPLINARDTCVLVSSRNNIQLTSGETLRLLKMSPEDAEDLLTSIAGKEKFEEKAGELAKLAGYLPMALKPLAKLLKKEFWTIARILKEYADKKKLLEVKDAEHDDLSVEASFALSYDALTDEQKRCWRSLVVFPADFESKAASTVFGLEFADGWNILEQLYDYSLIEKDAKSTAEQPRFILHDLARVFADIKLSDEERLDAQLRHAFYYASLLLTMQEMQLNNEENYYLNALKMIDAEWSNITAGQKWSASLVEQNDEAASLSADYSGYARDFIYLRLHPRENIDWLKSGLTAARKLNNRQDEGNSLCSLGIAYKDLGEHRKSIDYYEQSLDIYRSISDKRNESASLGNLGNAYYSLGEYQKAAEYHEQHLEISREIGDRLGEGNSLNNLGNIYYNLGEYRKTIEYNEQSLAIIREIGNRLGEGINLCNLGIAYLSLGEKKKACGLWKEALVIFEAIESLHANVARQNIENFCKD